MPHRLTHFATFIPFAVFVLACVPDERGGGSGYLPACDPDAVLTEPVSITSDADLAGMAAYSQATSEISVSGSSLEELEGFPCLSLAAGIRVQDASNLTQINGFQRLLSLSGSLVVGNNSRLTAIGGFPKLETIDARLEIFDSHALASLDGFSELRMAGGVFITGTVDLEGLDGLAGLNDITGDLSLQNNEALHDLSGLGALGRVTQRLTIIENPALETLAGLESLAEVESFEISDNPILEDVAGLVALETVTKLEIVANPQLASVGGLSALDSVDVIRITGPDSLTDLQGLEALTTVTAQLAIQGTSVSSLEGLGNLREAVTVRIIDNPALPTCDAHALVDQLDTEPVAVTIEGNLEDECSP
jgi:hypothetical protein